MTLPEEPSTLPKRTAINLVRAFWLAESDWIKISARRFVAPMTLVGLIALSVEIMTKRSTLYRRASSASCAVAKALFLIASDGWLSIMGTCLCAAAWKISAG